MSSNRDFFRERRAQAVLKHEILAHYPIIFASKLGYNNRRVVFLDGYAGRGQYEDGSPGSPLLLAQAADKVSGFRNVTAVYVEEDGQDFANLQSVVQQRAGKDFLLQGDVSGHLPQILAIASGAPLFAFFDPFGTALDRDDLVNSVMKRGRPAVEVLLHISVSSVARLGGLFRARRTQDVELSANEQKSIEHLDRFLGGEWWKDYFLPIASEEDEVRATEAALSVASHYQEGVCAETGFMSVSMPVRRRPHHQPKYILVLFTKHFDGLWFFADSLGKAGREWERAWRGEEAKVIVSRLTAKDQKKGVESLFGSDDLPDARFDPVAFEAAHRALWINEIAQNVKVLLGTERSVIPAQKVAQIYGHLLGVAGERHVNGAMRLLASEGVIEPVVLKDKYYRRPLRRPPLAP